MTGSAEWQYARAEAVFRGEVVETLRPSPAAPEVRRSAKLRVTQRWKGAESDTVLVADRTICPVFFEPGEEFLVYAHRGEDGVLETSFCHRTRPFARAADDVPVLDRLTREARRRGR